MDTLTDQGKEAAESPRRVYQAQEELRLEIVGIKNRLDGLEKSVEAIKPTSVEYQQVRDRVIFAGKLGGALWGVGKVILAAAAGAAAHWYSMTGRPPP